MCSFDRQLSRRHANWASDDLATNQLEKVNWTTKLTIYESNTDP